MTTSHPQSGQVAEPTWPVALKWLLFLGPFFYLSYGLANYWASLQPQVPSVVFAWEQKLPFIDWSILPYWTLNLFYAASLWQPQTRQQVQRLGLRLLTAQVIAVTCFVLFPLHYSFTKPETSGWSGWLFAQLAGFDQPYNQAPSLHIALLVILWPLYRQRVGHKWSWLLHLWFGLIGVSVLTTYQHHFIDIPTGVLLGALCLWLWPDDRPCPLAGCRFSQATKRRQLALIYAGAALSWLLLASLGGIWLWGVWPALALAGVAAIYAGIGPAGFQKNAQGRFSLATQLWFWPYLLAARLNTRLWKTDTQAVAVQDGVYLGNSRIAQQCQMLDLGLLDLTAELAAPAAVKAYQSFPLLDLCAPTPAQLQQAVALLEQARQSGPVLVYCALGYSRSVAVVVAWLYLTKRVDTLDAAIEQVRQLRPRLVLQQQHVLALQQVIE